MAAAADEYHVGAPLGGQMPVADEALSQDLEHYEILSTKTSEYHVICTSFQYGQSVMGRDLICWSIQPEVYSRTILLNFEIHGWEDAYAADGQLLVDFHGWLDCTIGSSELAEVFSLYTGINHQGELTTNANGYFTYWAQLQGAEALLVEFADTNSIFYSEVIQAVNQLMTGNYGSQQFDYELDGRFSGFDSIQCYMLTGNKVYTQSSVGETGTSYGYVDGANDLCTIRQIYSNGWCKINYPVGSSKYQKTGYCQFSNFIDPETAVEHYTASVNRTVAVYTTQSALVQLGSVWSTDTFTVVAEKGDMAQIIYPLDDGGYKMGWIDADTILLG